MKFRVLYLMMALAGILVVSCDKLDQPYSSEKVIVLDTNKRKVLLEDYTGMKCVNCPAATADAEALVDLYKGQVILMTVHAGYFSEPDASGHYSTDYRVTEGVSWFNDFLLISNPMGMVNRAPYNGKPAIGSGSWAEAVASVAQENEVASIRITTEYTPLSRHHINTTIETTFHSELPGAYNLTVCILEDSIVGWQKNNDPNVGTVPDIENYVFNDMLRAVLNGTYGEQVTNAVDTTLTYSNTYVYTINDSWNPDHLSLVAFVFNSETKEIIQVEKQHLVE
ncbi:MAG: Omp28-related outer membrane protein [Bacteroidales bacterium]|nr:Omp28-related outer membrane protein [Bacteroidales bacterium]